MNRQRNHGFTMIELLVVIGIIVILVGLSVPVVTTWFQGDTHSKNSALILDAFRDAKRRAMASEGGQAWSVRTTSTTIILYPGSTYQPASAIVTSLDGSTISGNTIPDVTFNTQHGVPSVTGTFTLTSNKLSTTFTLYGSGILSP